MLLLTINHQSLIATKANRIVRAAQGEDVCFVLLDDSAQSAEALEQALPELSDDGCQFRLAVETVLD